MPLPHADSDVTLQLLHRVAGGDTLATNDLLTEYRTGVHEYVDYHLDVWLRARVDVSDVVQEVLLTMSNRMADYAARRPMPFHVWVRKTAYERILNVRRDQQAARRDIAREVHALDQSSVMLAASLLPKGATPLDQVLAAEQAQQLTAAIAALPEADRDMLILRLIDHQSYEHVAQVMEITLDTARQRYSRALGKLQKILVDTGMIEVPDD
jgi:RNA polymerase sigma-70 factor, ECF subfamily